MAFAYVSDIIRGALQDIGVVAPGQSISATISDVGLERLNALRDQWAAEKLALYFSLRTVKAITANDGSYTIGSGGDVDIVRPVFLDDVRLIMDTTQTYPVETPLRRLTDEAYRDWPMKTQVMTLPTAWWYNPTFTSSRGTLELLPIPNGSNQQFVVYSPAAVPEFAAITTAFALPPAWSRFVRTNLALELCAPFEKEPSAWLARAAAQSMATVKRANVVRNMAELSMARETPMGKGRQGWYDILSDTNR